MLNDYMTNKISHGLCSLSGKEKFEMDLGDSGGFSKISAKKCAHNLFDLQIECAGKTYRKTGTMYNTARSDFEKAMCSDKSVLLTYRTTDGGEY